MRAALLTLAFVLCAGCSAGTFPPSDAGATNDGSASPDGGQSSGNLKLDWTIGGAANPSLCASHGAESIVMEIKSGVTTVQSTTAPCTDMTHTFTLAPGGYTLSATLVDAQKNARTTTASGAVAVQSGQTTDAPVDFPLSAFF